MMTARGHKRRGRPPKTALLDRPRNFHHYQHLVKKPKYLQNQGNDNRGSETPNSQNSTPTHSRNSSPVGSEYSRRSGRTRGRSRGGRGMRGRSSIRRCYNSEVTEYRDSEYHYGSDFGEDSSGKSDQEDDILFHKTESEDESAHDDLSDSDFSLSSYSSNNDKRKTALLNYTRNPSPIPIWLENIEYPSLELPKSSNDLLIPTEHIMQALSIYEVLRHFRNLVRLSPFRFEDFCAAVAFEDQTYLLTEIHTMLLRAIFREEEIQQTHFGALDQKDSVNISLYFIDSVSWPEVLRAYIESDRNFDKNVLDILNSCEYPFTNIADRLSVLQFLSDHFLNTYPVREDLIHEGNPSVYEEHCRICNRPGGNVCCCSLCYAVFHPQCLDPPLSEIPLDLEEWQCSICKSHRVVGVTDCISELEKHGLLNRQEHLGFDRHGRKYFFLARRIFVENEESREAWYYSCPAQLDMLLDSLDKAQYESALTREILEYKEEIIRQMKITERLTSQSKGGRKSYLEFETALIFKLLKEKEEKGNEEIESTVFQSEPPGEDQETLNSGSAGTPRSSSPDFKVEDEVDDDSENSKNGKKHLHVTRSRTGSLVPKTFTDDLRRKTEKQLEAAVAGNSPLTRLKAQQISAGTHLFKLGMDSGFKSYNNYFNTNPNALSKIQRNEERDRKRYLSHKFSLTQVSEFKWAGPINGSKSQILSTVRQTLLQLENAVPVSLMHVNWPIIRKPWVQAVASCNSPKDFAKSIILLQSCIKNPVYASVWFDQLGHIRLYRTTALEREERKKIEKREKKDREEEEERNRSWTHFVKHALRVKHQVWKQKGEEYRVHGQWGWRWLSAARYYKLCDANTVGLRAGAQKFSIQITDEQGVNRFLHVEPEIYKFLINRKDDSDLKLPDVNGLNLNKCKITPPIVSFDEIDVSKALTSPGRLHYPKLAKRSKLDDFLARRNQLKLFEERSLSQNIANLPARSQAQNDREVRLVLQAISRRANIVKHKFQFVNGLCKNYKCYSKLCNPTQSATACYSPLCHERVSLKNELLALVRRATIVKNSSIKASETEIKTEPVTETKSPGTETLRAVLEGRPINNSISSNPLTIPIKTIVPSKTLEEKVVIKTEPEEEGDGKKKIKVENIKVEGTKINVGETKVINSSGVKTEVSAISVKTEPQTTQATIKKEEVKRIYSSTDTRGKLYLKKLVGGTDRKKKRNIMYPKCSTFTTRSGKRSILVLPQRELSRLARVGGKVLVNGFNHLAKPNLQVWPYSCSRPNFRTCWLYRTVSLKTIAAAGLQLRILWASLRWDDMQTKSQTTDGKHQVTTETEIITTELLKQRHLGAFLERTEYLQRKVVIPIDLPKTVRVSETQSIRTGLRKRKREETIQNTEPKVTEEWVDDSKLELWEIKSFGERLEKQQQHVQMARTRSSTGVLQKQQEAKAQMEEMKEKMEAQLKAQRMAHQQKKQLQQQLAQNNQTENSNSAGKQQIIKIIQPSGEMKVVSKVAVNSSLVNAKSALTTLLNSPQQTPKSSLLGSRRIIMSKTPEGQTRIITSPAILAKSSSINSGQQNLVRLQGQTQKVQIAKGPDGNIQIRGLLPGQTLIQVDGKIQVVSTASVTTNSINVLNSTSVKVPLIKPVNTIPVVVSPKTPGKQIIVKQVIPNKSNSVASNVNTIGISASNISTTTTSSPNIAKPPNQIILNNPTLVQQLTAGKTTLATINGQQVILKAGPSGNIVAQAANSSNLLKTPPLVSTNGSVPIRIQSTTNPNKTITLAVQSSTSAATATTVSTTTAATPVITRPATSSSEVQTETETVKRSLSGLSEEQEKEFLKDSPSDSILKCLTAQVVTTTMGPRIMLSGLAGPLFTNSQLLTIQTKVKQELLKAQATGGNEGVLGPTKLYLAVHPSAQAFMSEEALQTLGVKDPAAAKQLYMENLKKEQVRKNGEAIINPENSLEIVGTEKDLVLKKNDGTILNTSKSEQQITPTVTPKSQILSKIAGIVTATPNSVLSTATTKKDGAFVLTQDYIQQTIKNALKSQNLSPEVEEKLLKLQRYQFEKQISSTNSINRDNINNVGPHNTIISDNRLVTNNQPSKLVMTSRIIQNGPTSTSTTSEEIPVTTQLSNNSTNSRKRSVSVVTAVESLADHPSSPKKKSPKHELVTKEPVKINNTNKNRTKSNQEEKKKQLIQSRIALALQKRTELLKKELFLKKTQSEKQLHEIIDAEIEELVKQKKPIKPVDDRTSTSVVSTVTTTSVQSSIVSPTLSTVMPSAIVTEHQRNTPNSGSGRRKSAALPQALVPGAAKGTTGTTSQRSGRGHHKRNTTATSNHETTANKAVSKKKLLCICKTIYDPTKFYVGCDTCNNWFHGECVDITEEASKNLSEFVCRDCKKSSDSVVYCLCKQPYDEAQFYIQCDGCEDWFHGRCVGILSSEAESIDEYRCPNCSENSDLNFANRKLLNSKDLDCLRKHIKQIQTHKSAWPFIEPVDPAEAPDYYKVITEPMDIQKIEHRINDKYYSRLCDFIADMSKVFENCRFYNPLESQFYRCADQLESFFLQKIKYIRNQIVENNK